MITLLGISFWLYFIYFFIAVFVAFFVPGYILLRKFSLSSFQKAVLGTVIGMVLWAWQGFVFGYLSLRWLSYVYIALFFVFWIFSLLKRNLDFSFKLKRRFPRIDWIIVAIIFFGVIIQLSSVFFNGILETRGLYFCCGDPTDNIFHIALTDQLVKNIPPFEPGMHGTIVKNYHYWGNLVVAELIRVFKLPLIAVQFQYSTLLVSLFLGLSAVVFGQIENLGKKFTTWLLFFLYFGGDLIFLLVSFMRRELNFNMSSLEDGAKFLVNPPRAFSIVIFFAGISLLSLWIKKKDLNSGLLTFLILGSLIGFKVYTGIFALIGVIFLVIYFLIKKDFSKTFILFACVISLIIYLPTNVNAGGLYFTGFALFENFIVQPWMMLDRLELARRIYLEHKNFLRVIEYEFIYVFMFTLLIFGTKLIGIFQTGKSLKLLQKELNIFLLGGIFVSLVFGFFFQQDSGGANTFNFLVSIFIISSIYASIACVYWFSKIRYSIRFFAIILLITLTVPRVLYQLHTNIKDIRKGTGFLVSNNELNALRYLREETDKKSLVLVDDRMLDPERSLYVSFLADRPLFLSGKGLLESHGHDVSEKNFIKKQIFQTSSGLEVAQNLLKSKIDYLYISYPYSVVSKESLRFTEKVYENQKITILKVLHDKVKLYYQNSLKQSL